MSLKHRERGRERTQGRQATHPGTCASIIALGSQPGPLALQISRFPYGSLGAVLFIYRDYPRTQSGVLSDP